MKGYTGVFKAQAISGQFLSKSRSDLPHPPVPGIPSLCLCARPSSLLPCYPTILQSYFPNQDHDTVLAQKERSVRMLARTARLPTSPSLTGMRADMQQRRVVRN